MDNRLSATSKDITCFEVSTIASLSSYLGLICFQANAISTSVSIYINSSETSMSVSARDFTCAVQEDS